MNAMILYFLILRLEEHKIERVRKVKKIETIKKIERIKEVRKIEKAIVEIR